MENIIELKNLKKYYEKGRIKALDGINLNIKKNEFISIVGPSGSGKSTLLNMIGALDYPTAGVINIAGKNIRKMSDKELCNFRAHELGFIFQLYHLLPTLTALENVMIPMFAAKKTKKERIKRAKELLELVSLEKRINNRPPQLSGGERQRVAIARALANNPKIILADEPTGNLDTKASERILGLLKNIWQKEKSTLILVTHNEEVAKKSNRIIYLLDGKIVNRRV